MKFKDIDWKEFKKVTPSKDDDSVMFLVKTIGEPVARFAVCEWVESFNVFCDYDECPFEVSHFAYITWNMLSEN